MAEKTWGKDLSNVTSDTITSELDDLLHAIEGLSSYTDTKEKDERSHLLLGSLFKVVGKLNYLLRNQIAEKEVVRMTPDQQALSLGSTLLDTLDQWILKIKEAFSKLAKVLKAQSYTIGFAIPLGINVSITFTP